MNRLFPSICVGLLCATGVFAQESYEGLVEPVRDVLMGPPVAGRVEVLHVAEGDAVKKGEKLLSLDDRIEALEVQRRTLVLEDESELKAARHRRDLLKDDYESTLKLFESTASVSRDELTRKQVEYTLSEVELNRVEQAERREEAELEIAIARMEQYHLVAPFDGILAERSVDPGESVQAGQPVVRVVDLSQAFLILNLPAEEAAALKIGEKVSLSFDVENRVRKSGEVAFISPVIDPASGLRKVKMLFTNNAPQVEPGRIGTWLLEGAGNE